MALSFPQLYLQIPLVTRAYTTACVLTTAAVQLEVITPLQLHFNPDLILRRGQIWRLITSFLFFGSLGFSFLFNIIFLYRYCRMLEEGCFRGRTADFVFMFLFGGIVMTLAGLLADAFFLGQAFLVFLGQAFIVMLAYVWSRRHPLVRMHFFGLLSFRAAFLPWVLAGCSLLLGNAVVVDLLGIGVGHVYYFLEDVFPNQPGGRKLLTTPELLRALFDRPEDPDYRLLRDELQGDELQGDELQGDELQGDELQRDELQGDELQRDELQGDELQRDELQRDELQGNELQGNELQGDELQGDELQGDELQRDELQGDELQRDELQRDER